VGRADTVQRAWICEWAFGREGGPCTDNVSASNFDQALHKPDDVAPFFSSSPLPLHADTADSINEQKGMELEETEEEDTKEKRGSEGRKNTEGAGTEFSGSLTLPTYVPSVIAHFDFPRPLQTSERVPRVDVHAMVRRRRWVLRTHRWWRRRRCVWVDEWRRDEMYLGLVHFLIALIATRTGRNARINEKKGTKHINPSCAREEEQNEEWEGMNAAGRRTESQCYLRLRRRRNECRRGGRKRREF
jgi:hypothetical protein